MAWGVKKTKAFFLSRFHRNFVTIKSSGEKRRDELRNMLPAGTEQGLEISWFTRGNTKVFTLRITLSFKRIPRENASFFKLPTSLI